MSATGAGGKASRSAREHPVLLDVNVLVALAWPNHIHHEAAVRWFEDNHRRGWATAPPTQSGFVRVSSNHKVIPEARTPAEAILLLQELTSLPGHVFWTDDVAVTSSKHVARERIVGYRQVTDAHLLALAIGNDGRLATFDAGVAELAPEHADDAVVVLAAG